MSGTWKRDFASGLIVITPLLVTVFVLTWLYNRIKRVPLQGVVKSEPLQVALAIVVFVLVVFAIGYLKGLRDQYRSIQRARR